MAEDNETIVLEIIAKASSAIGDMKEFRTQVDETKATLRELAKVNNESFDTIAKKIKDKVSEGVESAKDLKEVYGVIGQALKEVNKERLMAHQETVRLSKETTSSIKQDEKDLSDVQKASSKARLAEIKQDGQERIAFEKGLASTLSSIDKQELASEKQANAERKAELKSQEEFERKHAKVLKDIQENEVQRTLNETTNSKKHAIRQQNQLDKSAATSAQKAAKKIQAAWRKVGAVFATVLGVSAIGILRDFGNWIKQITIDSIALTNSIFKLAASTRALQRSGMDIALSDITDQIRQLRKDFSFFTTKEIVEGIGQIQLLTRSFGFTKDQMNEVTDAAAVLAVVMGKDMGESASQIALFLSSGYAEALQRMGLNVNKATIEQEALRMGLNKTYRELTQNERALAGLNIITRELAPLVEELANFEEDLAGQIRATTAAIEEQEDVIGQQLLPAYQAWLEAKLGGVQVLSALIALQSQETDGWRDAMPLSARFGIEMAKAWGAANGEISTFNELMEEVLKNLGVAPELDLGEDAPQGATPEFINQQKLADAAIDARDAFEDAFDDMQDDISDAYKELYDELGDIVEVGEDGIATIVEGGNEERAEIFDRFNGIIEAGGVETGQSILDNEAEWLGELGDIDEEGLQDLLDLWSKYFQKLEDIQTKYDQEIIDSQTDLSQDQEDLAIDVQRKQEDAERKRRENELKAERDFQNKLLKLKENFLFNLEDALREQDAKQVLRLIRRFNLDKKQLEREGQEEKSERDQKYQQELEDIELWRKRREQELQIEFARRNESLKLQADRERERAKTNRQRAYDDLVADLQRERDARVASYTDELTDISDTFEEKIKEIVDTHFAGLELSTSEMTSAVISSLQKAFGKDGLAYDIFTQLGTDIQGTVVSTIAAIQDLLAIQQSLPGAVINPELKAPETQKHIGGYAQGGSVLATQPTLALFGEAGPEVAEFTPLSQMNTLSGPAPTASLPGGEGVEDTVRFMVMLEPGLKGEIIDSTLNEAGRIVADIIGV